MKIDLSILIPVYGHNLELKYLFERLNNSLIELKLNYEVIFINDNSPDNSWDDIVQLSKIEKKVKGIKLSRNYGQHRAIAAGLKFVNGNWCIIMDCDLQDRPEEIINLYNKAISGYDIVMAKRLNRKDNILKKFSSKLFYIVFNFLTNQDLDNRFTSFGIFSKKVINALLLFHEKDRSTGLLLNLIGFKRTSIDVIHDSRVSGYSSYTTKSRFNMARDHILSHSTKPLELILKFGFTVTLCSSFYALFIIMRYLLNSISVPGWYSLIVSIFFFSGIIIMLLGMVGLYVGKIYNEVKRRPLFIIESTTF